MDLPAILAACEVLSRGNSRIRRRAKLKSCWSRPRLWCALEDDNVRVYIANHGYCRWPVGAFIFSGGALAADAAPPAPHWSGLPIWGAEAEARGYQLPLPFGIGVTAYSARQPVNIHDLQLGRNGNPPVSVKNFLQINRVDTSQQNVSAKLDVLVFPFLDVYALLGYTKGTTKGLIQVPGDPILGIIEPSGTSAQCLVQRPDLRRRCDPSRRVARSATGGT